MTYRQGLVLGATAAVLWSLMALLIRLIGDVTPWHILFYRSLGMIPVVIALLAVRGGGLASIRGVGLPGLIAGVGLVFAFSGAIVAIQSTAVANAVFLFSVAPLLTAIMAWLLLSEPVPTRTWGALALSAVGVFVMVREGLALGAGLGSAAAIVSATGFAVYTVASRWGRMSDMVPCVLLGAVLSAILSAGVIALQGTGLAIPLRSAAIALGMGAVILGFGMVFYTLASRVVPAAQLGIVGLVEITLAPVWVWLFLGESATPATFAGGAILLAAILLNTLGTGLPSRQRA